ncbi:MAG TPA: FAD-dependent oxidoreductase [Thermoanaerobaculia bacterium]|nr:FAD-dependent oxidoreductase [Thermoanaerobaculia bacterium]
MFDVIVVGKGLMGVAAWRSITETTANAAVIGPDEPAHYATHTGVFASHYDEGRLVGRIGKDRVWAGLITRSMNDFHDIEERSGVSFYDPRGRLVVAEHLHERLSALHDVERTLGIRQDRLDRAALARRFPLLTFPASYSAVFEPAPAGLLRPRQLLAAQLALGQKQGGTIIREEVHAIHRRRDRLVAVTSSGRRYEARRVLIAAGAFTNCYGLAPAQLAIRVKSEVTLLAEVSNDERTRLRELPTLTYAIASAGLAGIYLTPPLQYPDGRWYLKIGCDTATDQRLPDLPAMRDWMRRGSQDEMPAAMRAALLAFMPTLDVRSWQRRPCLVTYTSHGKPFIDQLDEHLFVATGGNGGAAQCSCTLGELAARLVLEQPWPDAFLRQDFGVRYVDDPGLTTERYDRLGVM